MPNRPLRRLRKPVTRKALPMATNALATVPEARYATDYIHRDISGVRDFTVFDRAFRKGQNILLYGPTGPGKTSAFMAWAAHRQKPFYSVASNIALDPSQMFGKYIPDEDGKFVWADGGVTDIVRHGGLLLFNEINFLSPRISPVVFELLDKRREITLLDRKGEKVRAHRPDCWCALPERVCRKRWVLIGADMNPDYAGTGVLNAAFRNRFPLQVYWDYDLAVEASLVKSEVLRELAVNGRRLMGTKLETPIPTNALVEFESLAKDFGLDFATENFVGRFTVEERPAIQGVFSNLMDRLKADFDPPQKKLDSWNYLEGNNAQWMDGGDDDADSEAEEDDEAFFQD